ncbi:MAG: transposase [Candidatus Anammoxibacter sp.]
MAGKGNTIITAEKEIVVRIKHYFDKEKKSSRKNIYASKSAVSLTSIATNLSEISVKRIMAEFKKRSDFAPPAPKGSSPYAIDESVKTLCQDIIRSHNINREHISLRLLVGILNDIHNIKTARETLRNCLFRWNILHGSVQRHTALRERDYVVNARREYLIQKRQLDSSNRRLVYLDETFINKNYSGSDSSWYCDDRKDDPALDMSYGPYINKPSGKGDRLIILNAVTNNGWIDGAKLVFQAKSNSGDYHGSMDEHNFTKWFTGQLLPNIPDNAVIIMDNASYHNTYMEDGVPPLISKKIVLQQWLSEKKIAYGDDFLRPQLIELINKYRPARIYQLDNMLKNNPEYSTRGIEILRTPQYHPELQPIEKCWAVMKQYMAKHCDFTLKGLHKNLERAWTKVTSRTMRGIMKKVTYWQDYHFEQDSLLDTVDDNDAQ